MSIFKIKICKNCGTVKYPFDNPFGKYCRKCIGDYACYIDKGSFCTFEIKMLCLLCPKSIRFIKDNIEKENKTIKIIIRKKGE